MQTEIDDFLKLLNKLETQKNCYCYLFLKIMLEQMNLNGEISSRKLLNSFKLFYYLKHKSGFSFKYNNAHSLSEINKFNTNELWIIIKSHSYDLLISKKIIRVYKNEKSEYIFCLSKILLNSLSRIGMSETILNINEKINNYFESPHNQKNEVSENNRELNKVDNNNVKVKAIVNGQNKNKIVLNPTNKLYKRIKKEFECKKFIGDIQIDDNEFEILIQYLKDCCRVLVNSYSKERIDPILSTALVQIGIRYYDGNFWRHVERLLGNINLNTNNQAIIGNSFIATLKSYKKIIYSDNERVGNILMHGFVSNAFAKDLFSFLFSYYRIDLDRDIARNTKKELDNLIHTIIKNDNTSRTYWIVNQTADAVRANTTGSKIRIRRYLRLIDKYFWERETCSKTSNRIIAQLNNWLETSKEIEIERKKICFSSNNERKKAYSSPYYKCNLRNKSFEIVLPIQLVKFDDNDNIKWEIKIGAKTFSKTPNLLHAVSGVKCEEIKIPIEASDLFIKTSIDLISNNTKLRTFKIDSEEIRFFDKNGYFINSDNLPKGEVFAFSNIKQEISSNALIEAEDYNGVKFYYFDFQHGDIVILSNRKLLAVGKKPEEGLLMRNEINGMFANLNARRIPVYSSLPSLFIKIASEKIPGTVLKINNEIIRLNELKFIKSNIDKSLNEVGYIINLDKFRVNKEGIYTVLIDVPNDKTDRYWEFAYIPDFNYEFEDSPYIFKEKGSIKINTIKEIRPFDKNTTKINGESIYNFNITPNLDELLFDILIDNSKIQIGFTIPFLSWSYDNINWSINKPEDLWHSLIPNNIYIKYPSDKIVLEMDETDDCDEDNEFSVEYTKLKSLGLFNCDMVKFKSWIGREEVVRTIKMIVDSNKFDFLNAITKSNVISLIIMGDFENDILYGEFEIAGECDYYADVEFNNKPIAEKIQIRNNKIEIPCKIFSGEYKITLYEDEVDESGFGDINYLVIGTFYRDVLNPKDITGRTLKIEKLRKIKYNYLSIPLCESCSYMIKSIRKIHEKTGNIYEGLFLITSKNFCVIENSKVRIEFVDLNMIKNCNIKFTDEYGDLQNFLYDNEKRIILQDEDFKLKASVRYRKYNELFDDDYAYEVSFIGSDNSKK